MEESSWAWQTSGREYDPPVPAGLRENILIGSPNWKCSGAFGFRYCWIQLLEYFSSGLCLTSSLTSAFLCQLHFQAGSPTIRDRDVPPTHRNSYMPWMT